MAPRRSGKVRVQGLQVADNNLAGAHADGGHHHQNIKNECNEVLPKSFDHIVGEQYNEKHEYYSSEISTIDEKQAILTNKAA